MLLKVEEGTLYKGESPQEGINQQDNHRGINQQGINQDIVIANLPPLPNDPNLSHIIINPNKGKQIAITTINFFLLI